MTVMPRFLTLHALHAMPASLLNRDDTGATKTIPFGGTTRVRVSSQAWKRAMRVHARTSGVTGGTFATRTRHLLPQVVAHLVAAGRDQDAATAKASTLLAALVGIDDKGRTSPVLFVPAHTAPDLAQVVDSHWEQITDTAPKDVTSSATAAFDNTDAVDLALFGRMLTAPAGKALPVSNIDAACSVAHAFSVDPARVTPDFFTAVDDHVSAEGESADQSMLGYADLSAPVLYRHAALSTHTLAENLAGASDADALTRAALEAFVDAFTLSVPTGKQTSTAATTLPALLVAVAADRDVSLADAFTSAVTTADTLTDATDRLLRHAARALAFLPAGARATVLPITTDPATITIPTPLALTSGTLSDLTRWATTEDDPQ